MKNIRIISLVVALLVFMSAYLLWSGDSNEGSGARASGGSVVTAVTATQDIKPNTVLTAEMLEVKEISVLAEDTDYFTTMEEAVGRIVTSDIFAGEKITSKRTLGKDASYGLSHKIGEGMRAFTITVDTEQGFSNQLKVGDRIDVMISMEVEKSGDANSAAIPAGPALDRLVGLNNPANTSLTRENFGSQFTTTVLQNIKIIALDMVTWYERGNSIAYSTLTVEVTPDQARQFALLRSEGAQISFALRPVGDDTFLNEGRSQLIKTREENEKEQLQKQQASTAGTTATTGQSSGNTTENTNTQAGNEQTSDGSNGSN